eukprot:4648384-Amphidinium_carterae.1
MGQPVWSTCSMNLPTPAGHGANKLRMRNKDDLRKDWLCTRPQLGQRPHETNFGTRLLGLRRRASIIITIPAKTLT